MRVHVKPAHRDNISPAVAGLSGNLRLAGYNVTSEMASYLVTIDEGPVPTICIDIPDAMFGRLVTHRVGELSPQGGVFVKIVAGNQDDRAVSIIIPSGNEKERYAVEVGVMRALDQVQSKSVLATVQRQATNQNLPQPELMANAVQAVNAHVDEAVAQMSVGYRRVLDDVRQALSGINTQIGLNEVSAASRHADVKTEVVAAIGKEGHAVVVGVGAGLNGVDRHCDIIAKIVEQSRTDVQYAIGKASGQLQSELMAYYTRKRWWQVWR